LLAKSASVRGFFLPAYPEHVYPHTVKLTQMIQEGKLKIEVDPKKFFGLEAVSDAVDYMYSGKNTGKVIVDLVKNTSKL